MSEEHQWIQSSDDEVRAHLQSRLNTTLDESDPLRALGCQGPEDLRKAFLDLTKQYHPNRFARRPEDIRDLASEVFLAIKDAHERAEAESMSMQLDTARAKARESGPAESPPYRSSDTRPPDSVARTELKERRREKLKTRLGTSSAPSKRTAQIRAATVEPPSEDLNSKDEEEERFAAGRALMEAGQYGAAASTFRALAVGRPSDRRYRMHMHHAQGRVHQQEGRIDEARSEYKRALGLDANFTAAHSAMSSLPGQEKKKSGIISRLFGK